jgi:cytochrome c553
MYTRAAAVVARVAVSMLISGSGAAAPSNDAPPDWAYPIYQREVGPVPESQLISLRGSDLVLTFKQVNDPFGVRDWFPEDHPEMPAVVARGRAPKLASCSFCHLPTGIGGPDNAAIAGLSTVYITQQIEEFRSGRRQCAVPPSVPCRNIMNRMAQAASDIEVKAAAEYFSQLPYRSRIQVIESAMVPKMTVQGFVFARADGGEQEPIGERILEVPDSLAEFDAGDWRTAITAYVPPGSIARGKILVEGATRGAPPCGVCHGSRLQGNELAPPLAGRSPSYIVRQLYDIQYGYRSGSAMALMQPVAARLNAIDRVAIAAYIASLR